LIPVAIHRTSERQDSKSSGIRTATTISTTSKQRARMRSGSAAGIGIQTHIHSERIFIRHQKRDQTMQCWIPQPIPIRRPCLPERLPMSASALRTSGKTRTDTAAVGVSLHTSCLQHVVVRCMPADIEGLKHSLVWAPLFTQAAGCDASPAWAGASASSSVTMRQRTLPCRCRCPQAPSMGVSSDGADQDGWWPPGQRTRGPDWRPRRRRCAQTAVYGLRVGLSSLTIRCCSCGSQLSDGDEVPVYAYRTVVTSRPSRYSAS